MKNYHSVSLDKQATLSPRGRLAMSKDIFDGHGREMLLVILGWFLRHDYLAALSIALGLHTCLGLRRLQGHSLDKAGEASSTNCAERGCCGSRQPAVNKGKCPCREGSPDDLLGSPPRTTHGCPNPGDRGIPCTLNTPPH